MVHISCPIVYEVAKLPMVSVQKSAGSDALSDVLAKVRLASTIFSVAEMDAPWGVDSRAMPWGIFHAFVQGGGWIRVAGSPDYVQLRQGDIVFLPHGDAHELYDDPTTPSASIRTLVTDTGGPVGDLTIVGDGDHTSIICGKFTFGSSEAHQLFSPLPTLLHYRPEQDDRSAWVASTLAMIRRELVPMDTQGRGQPGSETVIMRLTDVLLVHALRYYIETLDDARRGWMAGLGDRQVAGALDLIHGSPEQKWTAADLAGHVGMSRSAFFARFTELVGEPPWSYLTRWRMFLAAVELRDGSQSMSNIASRVGYATEAAFSKAFKRFFGIPPAHYRRTQRAA